MELISIIVPIYNVEKYLNRCIDSLINQTYKNIEILLIDDGSTDNSGIIADTYSKKYNNIKVYHKKNGGLSDARNYGIKHSNGDLLSFIDSDDYIDKNMIKTLYNDMKKYNTDISIVNYKKVYNDEVEPLIIDEVITMNKKEAIKGLFDLKLYGNYAWNKLYKKSLFKDIKFPKGKKQEDIPVMYKLFELCNGISYNKSELYYYTQREDSILNTHTNDLFEDKFNFSLERYIYINKHYPDIKENEVYFYDTMIGDYLYLYQNKKIKDQIKKYLGRFNISVLRKFSFNCKIKYLIYSINENLYLKFIRRIYK